MKKRIIFCLIILLVIGILIYFNYDTKLKKENTITIKYDNITEKAQAIGYIEPLHSSTVKSQINGTVKEIYHDTGDYVTKGKPLLKIKPAPSPTDYATTYQALEQYKIQEHLAKKDLMRYQIGLNEGLYTKQYGPYLQALQTYKTSKSQRLLAQQKLALLTSGSTKVAGKIVENIVTSPINGYILNRAVDVGDPVISLSSSQAATHLFNIANMRDLVFKGSVDESDAAKLHVGMKAKVIIGALSSNVINGVLTKLGLQSEKLNGITTNDTPFDVSFNVEIGKLDVKKNYQLRSGYSATADIIIKTIKHVLIIPVRVLHFENDKPYVLIPTKNNENPKKQNIKTGASDNINIEIKSGLKLNDKILDKPETKD